MRDGLPLETMRPRNQGEAWVQFDACGEAWALPAQAVEEVIPFVELDRPPCVPAMLMGWMSLAGEAMPVVSLGALLGQAEAPPELFTPLLVLRGSLRWALRVERVTQVFEVDPQKYQPLADTSAFNGMVLARLERGGRTVLLLDRERLLLERERQTLLDHTRRQQVRLAALSSPAGTAPGETPHACRP
jgi:purine-binding chemotaxis protein CheW